MSVAVKTNFTLLPETVKRMEELCKVTFRSKGDLVDWLIAEAYGRIDSLRIFGKVYEVVSVSTLPHPSDCEPVPVVTVSPDLDALRRGADADAADQAETNAGLRRF